MYNKKGFSLLELTLVLGIGTMVTFMKFQDMRNEQESVLASAVGQQMNQIGEAVNGYINIRYDKLAALTNAAGNGTDPGPRICSGSVCEITYQTLVNEGLLPSAYTGINANKSPYKILLRRDGSAPNYVINGIITTAMAWIENSNVRYDLLGNAMQSAGIDSGMTKSNTTVNGYGGQWSETSANFNNITSAGQLAYRVGYNSALYSVYLRRDGTLPMTGNLNMGGQNINNVRDINAGGNITSLMLRSIGDTNVGLNLNVMGDAQVNGNINSNNGVSGTTITSRGETYTQNWFRTLGNGGIYFQKWGGGWNMTDANTITAYGGKNIQTIAGIYGGYIKSTGNIDSNGNINANGDINSNRVFSNYIQSNGRVNVGEFLQMNGVANEGTGCSPNGLIARNNLGEILSCRLGIWTKNDFGNIVQLGMFSTKSRDTVTEKLSGSHKLCTISGIMSAGDNGTCRVYPSGNTWYLEMMGYNGTSTQSCWVTCID